jgi:hypothetical protein
MNEPKHTPGGWSMVPGRKHFHIMASDGSEVVRVHCASPASNPTQAVSNAYLIAAAPTILAKNQTLRAALQDIIEQCPNPKTPYANAIVNIAREALKESK